MPRISTTEILYTLIRYHDKNRIGEDSRSLVKLKVNYSNTRHFLQVIHR